MASGYILLGQAVCRALCCGMELAFRVFGEVGATPVVIVHGLLGSSRNWQTAAKDLGERYRVYALDLRNHGDSPHASPHSYAAMCEDLVEWMESQSIAKAILIGHSMGGKLAMKFACERPERVAKLVVVDIAPKVYPNSHDDDLSAMLSIDTHSLANRSEADEALQTAVPDWGLRQFLLTSLISRTLERSTKTAHCLSRRLWMRVCAFQARSYLFWGRSLVILRIAMWWRRCGIFRRALSRRSRTVDTIRTSKKRMRSWRS